MYGGSSTVVLQSCLQCVAYSHNCISNTCTVRSYIDAHFPTRASTSYVDVFEVCCVEVHGEAIDAPFTRRQRPSHGPIHGPSTLLPLCASLRRSAPPAIAALCLSLSLRLPASLRRSMTAVPTSHSSGENWFSVRRYQSSANGASHHALVTQEPSFGSGQTKGFCLAQCFGRFVPSVHGPTTSRQRPTVTHQH